MLRFPAILAGFEGFEFFSKKVVDFEKGQGL